MTDPERGEVWLTAFGAGRPGEPTKHRPAVVVSVGAVTVGNLADLFVTVPLSGALTGSVFRPTVPAGEGVDRDSVANCAGIRGINRSRLVRKLGHLSPQTLARIDAALAGILGLETE